MLSQKELVGILPNESLQDSIHICWMLHNQCNNKCSYCNELNWGGSHTWLKYDHIIQFLEMLFAHYDKTKKKYIFSFTGGEPTLWPKFFDLCEYLKSRNCYIGMTTNASRRNQFFERSKDYFNFVAVSYHPEFAKDEIVLDNIVSMAKSTNVGIRVMMHKDPEMWDRCIKFGEKLREIKGDPPFSLEYIPLLEGFSTVNPTPTQYADWQQEFLDNNPHEYIKSPEFEIQAKYKYEKDIFHGINALYGDGSQESLIPEHLVRRNQVNFENWSCHIGLDQLFIDERGNIWPSGCQVGQQTGHIFDDFIDFPTRPVICTKNYCACTTDILTTKFSPNYKHEENLNSPLG